MPQPPDPNQNIEQQIDEMLDEWGFGAKPGSTKSRQYSSRFYHAELKREILALISKQVQNIKDQRIRDSRSLCGCPMCEHHTSVYDLHVAEQTPPTPNGDEQGASASPSTPTALSKQADNQSMEAIVALKRLSNRLKGAYKPGMTGEEMRNKANEQIDKLIVKYGGTPKVQTILGSMTKDEFIELASDHVDDHFPKGKTTMRGEAMVLVAMICSDLLSAGLLADVSGLVENEPLASQDVAKKPTPTAPTSANREEDNE